MLLSLVAASLVLSILTCLLVLRLGSKVEEGGDVVTAAELQSLKEKVGGTEVSMREEFGRSRKEAADLAQSQREEQRKSCTFNNCIWSYRSNDSSNFLQLHCSKN